MFQPFYKVDRKLRIGLWVALALSALFAATAIPWSRIDAGTGVGTFLGATIMLWLPYFCLYSLLARAKNFPRFQGFCFAVFALPAALLPIFQMSATPSGGWEFVIVPFWQLVLHAILFYALKAIEIVYAQNVSAKPGKKHV